MTVITLGVCCCLFLFKYDYEYEIDNCTFCFYYICYDYQITRENLINGMLILNVGQRVLFYPSVVCQSHLFARQDQISS